MKKRNFERVGEIHKNKYGNEFIIIKYNHVNDITVEFNNGYIKEHVQYSNIKKGIVTSPYDKTVCNIGYVGEGNAPVTINNKASEPYTFWNNMIKRCYSKSINKYRPTYESKVVCEEWLNYNTFYKWYEDNYYTVNNEKMMLDKDILHKGNRIYSSDNCVFAPQYINSLFTKCDKSRGKYLIGVSLIHGKFISHISKNGKNNNLGEFKTEQEAFERYKIEKEKFIKQKANEYKDYIPEKLYRAMYEYKVEPTD
jgi:predicted transport protein